MKPCKHITASMIHIFDWHTQALQLMMLDPGHSVSSMPVHGKLGDEMEGRFTATNGLHLYGFNR